MATTIAPLSGTLERTLRRRALQLVWMGLLWNVVEGGVALVSAVQASSTTLLAFGADSVIELFAGGILVWHLQREFTDRPQREDAERQAYRLVGVTFFALAAFVTVHSLLSLTGVLPEAQPSTAGIVIVLLSALVMTTLYFMKTSIATKLGSPSLRAEARQALYCDLQDLPVIVGLVASAAAGWWWADPLVALAIVPLLIKEGREGLRGESCAEGCAPDAG